MVHFWWCIVFIFIFAFVLHECPTSCSESKGIHGTCRTMSSETYQPRQCCYCFRRRIWMAELNEGSPRGGHTSRVGFLVCLPCWYPEGSCDSTSSSQCFVAPVPWQYAHCGNDTSLHVCHKGSSSAPEPWSSSCHHWWSATVCPWQANPMDMASHSWRGPLCIHIWWTSHREWYREGKLYCLLLKMIVFWYSFCGLLLRVDMNYLKRS